MSTYCWPPGNHIPAWIKTVLPSNRHHLVELVQDAALSPSAWMRHLESQRIHSNANTTSLLLVAKQFGASTCAPCQRESEPDRVFTYYNNKDDLIYVSRWTALPKKCDKCLKKVPGFFQSWKKHRGKAICATWVKETFRCNGCHRVATTRLRLSPKHPDAKFCATCYRKIKLVKLFKCNVCSRCIKKKKKKKKKKDNT
jgi:hypothetical protein